MHALHRPDCLPASRQRGCVQCLPIVPDDCRSCLLSACRANVRSISTPSRTPATSVSPAAASCPARSRPSLLLCANGAMKRSPSPLAPEPWPTGPGKGADGRATCAPPTLPSLLSPRCALTPDEGRHQSVVGTQYRFGIRSMQGQPDSSLQIVGCSRTARPFLSVSGVDLARIGVHVAVARRREVHRSLLAVSGNTVPRLVPRGSQCMYVTAHPSPDPPLSECFH